MESALKYQQIIDSVYADIKSHKLKEGDKLDSENRMSEKFQVSRQTVRHALAILEARGMLEKRQGSGNYILIPEKMKKQNRSVPQTITIVSTYLENYIFPRIITEIESVLGERGHFLRVLFTHNKRDSERAILERLLQEEEIGGIIIEPTKSNLPNMNRELYYELMRRNIPMLFFNSYYQNIPIPHVSLDDMMCGMQATEYLIAQGHRRIAGIFKMDDGQGMRRYEGYVKALAQHHLALHDERIVWIDTEEQNHMRKSTDRILERLRDCTACVCYNDEVAYNMIQICADRGIRVPEELSIIGIDNSNLSELSPVPLTTVAHPMEKLGRKVAEQFLRLLEEESEDVTYEFTPKLVIRDSVKRLWNN